MSRISATRATPGRNATKPLGILCLMIGVLALTGCGNVATNATRLANSDFEAAGWPFRWTSENVKGGAIVRLTLMDLPSGPTKADAILKQDTLAQLAKSEAAANRPAPQIDDIKPLKDGREVWVLKSTDGEGLAYVVDFKPSPLGGVDIAIRGPQRYNVTPTGSRSEK